MPFKRKGDTLKNPQTGELFTLITDPCNRDASSSLWAVALSNKSKGDVFLKQYLSPKATSVVVGDNENTRRQKVCADFVRSKHEIFAKVNSESHKHLVKPIAFFLNKSSYYVAYPFKQAKPTEQVLDSLSYQEKIQVMLQTTLAIKHFHKLNLVYSAIRPSNLIICTHPIQTYLINYDSVYFVYSPPFKVDVDDHYRSPEMNRYNNRSSLSMGSNLLTLKSDIFSLGVLFYRILMGEAPDNLSSSLRLGSQFNITLIKLVHMMTSFSAKDRPSTSEVYDQLMQISDTIQPSYVNQPKSKKIPTNTIFRSSSSRSIHSRSRYELPFILSGLYRRYRDAHNISEKYAYAITYAEGIFRFFAYINVSNVIAIDGVNHENLENLHKLLPGSIGTFVQVNQWAHKIIRSKSNQFFCKEMKDFFKSDAWKKAQTNIPRLRNQLAHGSLITKDDESYQKLDGYITELTQQIQWLHEYRLGVFTDGSYRRRSQSYTGYWRLSAGLAEDAEPIRIELKKQESPFDWDQVVLLNPSCDQMLYLSPFIYRVNCHGTFQYFWLEKFSSKKDRFVYRHPHLTDSLINAQPRFENEPMTPKEYEEIYPELHRIEKTLLSPESIRMIQSPHDLASLEEAYDIIGKVGEGGMGVVYEAYHKVYEKRFALKVLKDKFTQRNIDLKRFVREARLLINLDHPRIVKIYGIHKEENTHFIVMDFIEGDSLKSYLDRKQKLPNEMAIKWLCQILEALDYIHKCNIIHRDLKPSNIMISNNQIKLIDFGIAKKVDRKLTRTATQSILGTELYMAPEQWEDQASHLSDLYTCGLLLGAILGAPPRIPNCPPKLPELLNFPYRLNAIYEKATSLKPDQRYQSAAEFLEALSELSLDQGIKAKLSSKNRGHQTDLPEDINSSTSMEDSSLDFEQIDNLLKNSQSSKSHIKAGIDLKSGLLFVTSDKKVIRGKTVKELYNNVIKHLMAKNLLNPKLVPWNTSAKRYLIAKEPIHPSGKPFKQPIEVLGFYVESNKSRDLAPRQMQKFIDTSATLVHKSIE